MYSDVFCKVYNELGWNYFPEAFAEELLCWLREKDIPVKMSLDLACGSGVLCEKLREAGIAPMGTDLSIPLSVRMQVFGRGEDALDAMAQQVVVFENGVPVGAGRLWWADGAFRLGDMCVLESKRGRGFGDLLIWLLLYKSLTHSASLIRLETPAETEAFFAQYGFITDGETESGLKAMHIRGEDVQLSHCGGNCAECGHRSEECVPKALRE